MGVPFSLQAHLTKMSSSEKPKVLLVYPCYVCTECGTERGTFSIGSRVIAHMNSAHDITLSPRPKGARRPMSEEYTYVSDPKEPHDVKHFACPSCWFHTPDYTVLHTHIYNDHNIIFTEKSRKKEVVDYNGTHYPKRLVNEIFNQINALTTKFQNLLKM